MITTSRIKKDITESLNYAEFELNYVKHVVWKLSGFNRFVTKDFMKKFLKQKYIEIDENTGYWTYTLIGLRNILQDEWFMEKLTEVVNSKEGDHFSKFRAD